MRWADPTPPEVRDRIAEILERDEFLRRTNPISRFLERIGDWLARRTGGPQVEVGSGTNAWGGPIGSIFLWLALVLLVAVLVFVIVAVVRNRRPGARKKKPGVEVDVDDLRAPSEWAGEAERLEAAGEWKDAMRCRYRELVARLVEARVVSPLAGRTPGELRADLADAMPSAAATFDAASLLFELPWYADAPTGPAENARFRAMAAQVVEMLVAPRSADAERPPAEVGA